MHKRLEILFVKWLGLIGAVLLASSAICRCQETSPSPGIQPPPAVIRQLEIQVQELRATMSRMENQMEQMKTETASLRSELHDTQARLAVAGNNSLAALSPQAYTPGVSSPSTPGATPSKAKRQDQEEDRLSRLEEEQQLLEDKMTDQYQTKVEGASKYRVRLSGIALLNVFANRGAVENQDVPTWARNRGPLDSNETFGATVRQSEIGLEVFGPELAGAKTRGEIQMDFFGGFPNTSNGIAAGAVRMKIATARMDWKDTSIVAGQDVLFFSPLSPDSYASLAEPALTYSGNLWTWTPQIRVQHRINISDTSAVILQGGILDPLTGEPPSHQFFRSPQGGERGGQPAFASRVAWTQTAFGRPLTVGVGGYFSKQYWGFRRNVNGWAGTADLDLPLGRMFKFSSEFYRGRGIGGLGGALGRSVIYNGDLDSPTTSVLGLNTVGGWGQVNFQPNERLEFNVALGQDNPLASDIGHFQVFQSYFGPPITRNRSGLANVIYRPRSNLILSLEYRRFWTFNYEAAPERANHVNLGIGVLF